MSFEAHNWEIQRWRRWFARVNFEEFAIFVVKKKNVISIKPKEIAKFR